MPTNWSFCQRITQTAEVEQHVPWIDIDNFYALKTPEPNFVGTEKPLLHMSNFTAGDFRMKTWYLHCTNFSFAALPNIITGVQVELNMKRGGRITDDTVQLEYNGTVIGDNRATASLEPKKTFGGEQDLWGTTLTKDIISSATFGICLRFQSHPYWPHKETPMLNYIQMRIW